LYRFKPSEFFFEFFDSVGYVCRGLHSH
jgi:hypothetical protein